MHKVVNGIIIELTTEEIQARLSEESVYLAEQEAIANNYVTKRKAEYPPLEEQLDMMYKDKRDGTNTWFDLIDNIKKKYPKPVGDKHEN